MDGIHFGLRKCGDVASQPVFRNSEKYIAIDNTASGKPVGWGEGNFRTQSMNRGGDLCYHNLIASRHGCGSRKNEHRTTAQRRWEIGPPDFTTVHCRMHSSLLDSRFPERVRWRPEPNLRLSRSAMTESRGSPREPCVPTSHLPGPAIGQVLRVVVDGLDRGQLKPQHVSDSLTTLYLL